MIAILFQEPAAFWACFCVCIALLSYCKGYAQRASEEETRPPRRRSRPTEDLTD